MLYMFWNSVLVAPGINISELKTDGKLVLIPLRSVPLLLYAMLLHSELRSDELLAPLLLTAVADDY